jgi:hypothetical protein
MMAPVTPRGTIPAALKSETQDEGTCSNAAFSAEPSIVCMRAMLG